MRRCGNRGLNPGASIEAAQAARRGGIAYPTDGGERHKGASPRTGTRNLGEFGKAVLGLL